MNKRQITVLIIGSVLLFGLFVGYLSETNSSDLHYKITSENSSPLAKAYASDTYVRNVEDTNQSYRNYGLLIISVVAILMFITGEKNNSTKTNESIISNNENQNENLEISELKIKIKRLTDLKDGGIITEEEFEAKKEKLLSEFV